MGKQVAKDSYLSHYRKGLKWYEDPTNGKTHPVFVAMKTVVHPKQEAEIYLKKIPLHMCSQKYDISFFQHSTFILYYYCHHIIFDNNVRRYRIVYENKLSEYSKEDSD